MEGSCPYCNIKLEVQAERYNGTCICPSCKKDIEVDFDFISLDDGDEWDIYQLLKKEEQNYGTHVFPAKVIDE